MLQRSSRNSGVCHCMLAVELRTVHNYVIHRNLGETRVSRHRRREREREREREGEVRWGTCHAAMHPNTHTHTHTYAQTLPLLCSNNGSIATHKCTGTGSEGTQRKKNYAPKPSRAVSEHTKKQKSSAKKKRVPCSAFRCARPWREKSNREGQREHLRTTAHQYYSCIVIMHALPWWQTMAITLKRKSFPECVWKLPAETDKWLIIKRAAQHGNVK